MYVCVCVMYFSFNAIFVLKHKILRFYLLNISKENNIKQNAFIIYTLIKSNNFLSKSCRREKNNCGLLLGFFVFVLFHFYAMIVNYYVKVTKV